ncbi:hypothetical protein OIU76_020746 [Salix suchowensis]|nr:hypothetical protein OIU76_020746 [Salix suchowensis]
MFTLTIVKITNNNKYASLRAKLFNSPYPVSCRNRSRLALSRQILAKLFQSNSCISQCQISLHMLIWK